jgi:hypothetical protein
LVVQLLDLVQSHRVTTVIYIAAKLGIANLLMRPFSSLLHTILLANPEPSTRGP